MDVYSFSAFLCMNKTYAYTNHKQQACFVLIINDKN